jgi:gamma-glutamyltranspeptidase/glutathione hydrolase
MVATAHPEATRIGVEILRAGGNAVDAAIAANAALGVVEPMMCGIGGDLMAMVWNQRAQWCTGVIGAGLAPQALTVERARAEGLTQLPMRHPFTWTVPGCVKAWAPMHAKWCTKPLDELLAPAIRLAEQGCPVPPVIARDWDPAPLAPWPEAQRVYLPNGQPPRAGDIFHNPDLAQTLRRIGADWRDFYHGETAERIIAFCRANGGLLDEDDFAEQAAEWRTPLRTTYRDHSVHALHMPTQGIAVLEMLNLLEPLDLAAKGWGSVENLHAMIEAKKIAFEDRGHWIHDHFQRRTSLEQRLVSKEHARDRWRHFDPAQARPSYPSDLAERGDTTCLCASDGTLSVSLIQSICGMWGSGAVPDGLGFCLQNRGVGFSLDPNHPCCVAPLKRPLHTIIPGFAMKDGKPWLCFGVMGGTMQPQGQVQILTNMIDFGMDVQSAGEAPRWRHEGSSDVNGHAMRDGGAVHLEHGFPAGTTEALRARGHHISHAPVLYGGYQGIFFDHARGLMMGGSDPRKDGCAMGV